MKIWCDVGLRVWVCSITRAGLCFSAVSVLALASTHAAGLNDTGQTQCYDAGNVPVACSAAVGGDVGVNPRQDGRYGRDAAATAGQLTKVGAGAAGFDYSKIANDGSALAASAILGSAATDWACTKDNVTGLVWEVKTSSGLRSSAHTYTWLSTDATSNGGYAGALGTNTCASSLAVGPYCNTQYYVAAVNALGGGLCGASDWRLPSQRELLSIVHAGSAAPSIDTAYFPNTSNFYYWTATSFAAFGARAWVVYFYYGGPFPDVKTNDAKAVRLVRGRL